MFFENLTKGVHDFDDDELARIRKAADEIREVFESVDARDRKLEQARHQRQLRRAAESLAHFSNTITMTSPGATEAGSAGMQPC
jgi:hypothetical protein